jgi:hypothetical protein
VVVEVSEVKISNDLMSKYVALYLVPVPVLRMFPGFTSSSSRLVIFRKAFIWLRRTVPVFKFFFSNTVSDSDTLN